MTCIIEVSQPVIIIGDKRKTSKKIQKMMSTLKNAKEVKNTKRRLKGIVEVPIRKNAKRTIKKVHISNIYELDGINIPKVFTINPSFFRKNF